MVAFFNALAGIVASYLPAAMFFIGCGVAVLGTGLLVLELADRFISSVALSRRTYADLFRFMLWRTSHKNLSPQTVYERMRTLEEALAWCSAARDFQSGGTAREGWLRVCKPLLDPIKRPHTMYNAAPGLWPHGDPAVVTVGGMPCER